MTDSGSINEAGARPAAPLPFYLGLAGALLPLFLFLAGVTTLGLLGAPDERGFWPVAIAALVAGVLLCRDRSGYAEAVVRGMSQPLVALMILAWLLAGILAEVLRASGLIEALVSLASSLGLHGGPFVAAAYLCAALFSTATGTSLGTLLITVPLIYPAAGELGANPLMLLAALLGGATFGDNISPISDTTIASASTQEANLGDVVRSRLWYALPAAAVSLFVAFVWGGAAVAGEAAGSLVDGMQVRQLLMLLAPALALGLLLRGRHLVVALLAAVTLAVGIGLVTGTVPFAALLHIDRQTFGAQGLLRSGIDRGVGVSILTLLLMGLVGGMEASGALERLVERARRSVKTIRGAEVWIFGAISGAVLLTTHSAVAILSVGRFARETSRRFGIAPTRSANLLDVTACTYPFLLPYFIPTILAASLSASGEGMGVVRQSALAVGLANVHSWALLALVLFALLTGWPRRAEEQRLGSLRNGPLGRSGD